MTQQVFVHIGLPKTGTTTLQSILVDNRPALLERGLLFPQAGQEGHFRGAVDVVGWQLWGVDPSRFEGAWPRLVEKVREHDGPSVISHEILARAKRPRIDYAFEALAGLDVHVVVTARDLARQVTAVWQERVKNGRRYDFDSFLDVEGVLRTAREDRRGAYFWREQDLGKVLQKWAEHVPADHVHIVTCPPPGADEGELAQRFFGVIGVDVSGLEAPDRSANRSLGLAETELLRRVNVELHDHLTPNEYVAVVKRRFTKTVLGRTPGSRAEAPEWLRAPFESVTQGWLEAIGTAGYNVHGDLSDLTEMSFGEDPSPEVTATELVEGVPGLLAELLLEIAEQRAAHDQLQDQSARAAKPNPRRWRGRRWRR